MRKRRKGCRHAAARERGSRAQKSSVRGERVAACCCRPRTLMLACRDERAAERMAVRVCARASMQRCAVRERRERGGGEYGEAMTLAESKSTLRRRYYELLRDIYARRRVRLSRALLPPCQRHTCRFRPELLKSR